ncbi:MAG TPA: aldo/keto reductase [Pyrinomonadaceae bacterium]|jgi:aryl-alcohol dehydrogenase-like predicted oxidoreductase
MSLPGFATSEGTTHYLNRFKGHTTPGHFRNQQNLHLSSIGIGTYLGNADQETDHSYADAIRLTVKLGGNVIDSAANYRFQRSERSIGSALRTLINGDGFTRDELVLCTKGGYLPFDGAPPRDIRRYIEETFVRPGIATFADIAGGSHCMTPAYLENQLTQSLGNMDVECVDVYYVHNPESQLDAVEPEEFESRLRAAFEFLERARGANKIKMYGVATWNGFRVPRNSSQYHSLTRMVELAQAIAGEAHGFRFIQLPFNLAMPEALTLQNQILNGEAISTVEAARELGLTVVASASILQGRVARGLPDELRQNLGSLRDAQAAIQFVRSAPGITTALVGMSHAEHVEENFQLGEIEPMSAKDFINLFGQ